MIGLTLLSLALAAQPRDPHVIESHQVETSPALSGRDFVLISNAAQHPAIKGRDLSCYRIFITTERGVRTVSFLGVRAKLPPDRDGEIVLGFPKQNPRCPDRSFVMDERGRVVRVIYSSH